MNRGKWKSALADYLSFSKKERWAVLLLVVIVLALFIAPEYLPAGKVVHETPDTVISRLLADWERSDSLSRLRTGAGKFGNSSAGFSPASRGGAGKGPGMGFPVRKAGERFYFDPNNVGQEELERLGIPAKTALTIIKYREKGGRFRSPEDLRKIYSLPASLAGELIPWVRIAVVGRKEPPEQGQDKQASMLSFDNGSAGIKMHPKTAASGLSRIHINQADSLAWINLPGIGPRLAGRIISFRGKLGGFNSVNQVAEVYGLPDSVFKKILPLLEEEGSEIRRLNINTATKEELAAHPYINWQVASSIVQYRLANGPFQQVEDLRKIHSVEEEVFKKLAPYCKIN